MVQTIGKPKKIAAILFLNHWKTKIQNVQYSKVFSILAATVLLSGNMFEADLVPFQVTASLSGTGPQKNAKSLSRPARKRP